MSLKSLEARLAKLEAQVAELLARRSPEPQPEKNWRRTIGMFANDEFMEQVFAEGQKWRESERRRARRRLELGDNM